MSPQDQTTPHLPDPHGTFSDTHQLSVLSNLLDELGIQHSGSIESLISASQQWRRKPGQERWEMHDTPLSTWKQNAVMNYLKGLNLVEELMPSSLNYKYTLLLGATVPRMERRLNHLVRLWNEGIRFQKIVFLVGQRPLNEGIDNIERLVARSVGQQAQQQNTDHIRPMTETEGAKQLYASMDLPETMRQVPVEFIDSPRNWQLDHWQRANTRDTLVSWMKDSPAAGKTLVISDQPHAMYQLEVVKQELPEGFSPEVSAQEADPDTRIVLYLDALALWLYNLGG
jgi:hypothetical protein